jgi:hypothetical protein
VVLFFRLKSAHRACGVGVRDDGHESEIFQSTPCVIRDGRAAKLLSKDEARRIATNFGKVARATEVATSLALTAHEKLGPPFSGPKLEEVRSHGTAGDDGAVRAKH